MHTPFPNEITSQLDEDVDDDEDAVEDVDDDVNVHADDGDRSTINNRPSSIPINPVDLIHKQEVTDDPRETELLPPVLEFVGATAGSAIRAAAGNIFNETGLENPIIAAAADEEEEDEEEEPDVDREGRAKLLWKVLKSQLSSPLPDRAGKDDEDDVEMPSEERRDRSSG